MLQRHGGPVGCLGVHSITSITSSARADGQAALRGRAFAAVKWITKSNHSLREAAGKLPLVKILVASQLAALLDAQSDT
jgi:hypothetical protein